MTHRTLAAPTALLGVLLATVATAGPPASPAKPDTLDFNFAIRPILSDRCLTCHGPDQRARKADLRLDVAASALESGAIVPGKPDESELIRRVSLPESDPDHMPPV